MNTPKKRLSKQEKIDWDLLYEYVRSQIMLYDASQSLSRHMVLRLKGMLNGKFYANNNTSDNADYSYKIVLLTFKLCHKKIINATSTKNFESELQRFNYICAIVENNLNDTYIRIKKANQNEDKTKNVDANIITHNTADYKQKTKNTPSKLNDLW